jgi:hypothetical protein
MMRRRAEGGGRGGGDIDDGGDCRSASSPAASKKKRLSEVWSDPDFWRAICPGLSIEGRRHGTAAAAAAATAPRGEGPNGGVDDNGGASPSSPSPSPASSFDSPHRRLGPARREQLRRKGYASVDEPFAPDSLVESLRDGVGRLCTAHSRDGDGGGRGRGEEEEQTCYPAPFVFLFDEAWELAAASSSGVMSGSTLASNRFHFDLLAWHVSGDSEGDSGRGGGFSPHRDRQPDDVASSFSPEGDAKFVTHWVALSEAAPDNSCLYVIPKDIDPGYLGGDGEEVGGDGAGDGGGDDAAESAACAPLHRALSSKESFQRVRAFPRKPGQGVLFTHRVAHWGSARDPDTLLGPRIAVSFVCSDPSFEAPYLLGSDRWISDETGELERAPPFGDRLLLVCAQLLAYHERLELSRPRLAACYECCKRRGSQLEPRYRRRVLAEFVGAMEDGKSRRRTGAGGAAEDRRAGPLAPLPEDGSGETEDDGGDDEDEEEEAMMEAMLDAEADGRGGFRDDYDDLGGSDDDEEAAGTSGGCVGGPPAPDPAAPRRRAAASRPTKPGGEKKRRRR